MVRTIQQASRRQLLACLLVLVACAWLVGLGLYLRGYFSKDSAAGLQYDGMVLGTSDNGCELGWKLTKLGNRSICTHGPDPAPEGVDVRKAQSPQDLEDSLDTGTGSVKASSVTCSGDGQSGNRIQLVYARASDKPDRYVDFESLFTDWAHDTDSVVSDSAAKTGGTSHVRFVHDGSCVPIISQLVLSAAGDDTFSQTITEAYNAGFNRLDRKYLIWTDANIYCGIGTMWFDDSMTGSNSNNTGQSYARVDNGCWGLSNPVEAHELLHMLGAVQPTAPNSDTQGHCTDDYDRMCYAAVPGVTMRYLCSAANERLLDCNNDDYFSTAAPDGSYLSTHWNSANNSFLDTIGSLALYRMYYPPHNKHFWTFDAQEKNNLVAAGFNYEGVVGFDTCTAGTPVFRLVHPQGKHFWTTNGTEMAYLLNVGFKLEGVAFYACNSAPQPVYRLYNFPHNKHMWTTSVAERDWLVGKGFTYEGIVW